VARYADALALPESWYFVATSAGVPPGTLRSVQLGGRALVLWRGRGGALALQSAFCPHLGAHLGHGGRVRDDAVECPFHGFRFDGAGQCVATGYDTKPPPTAHLACLPVIERHGLVLAWLGDAAPTWTPPDVSVDGWTDFQFHQWSLRGHPQETTENSVDIGHFGWVHGYRDVTATAPLATDGPHLRSQYAFTRPLVRGWAQPAVREEIDVHVWGLGYSRVEVADQSVGARFRLLVLPTPIAVDALTLQIALSVYTPGRLPDARWFWRWLPRWLIEAVVQPQLVQVYRGEVEQDFDIWKHKAYLPRPALADGDGPVGRYRRWARQFYPASPSDASGSADADATA
jgi:phenylpropionate dioxygenase-like ring-hydroxylating dioxygenase large terminal subunit